jgi:hypothetical protein
MPLPLCAAERLDGTNALQQSVELAFLGLQVAVSANVLLSDEDVGHASLARDFLEGILEFGATVCEIAMSARIHHQLLEI